MLNICKILNNSVWEKDNCMSPKFERGKKGIASPLGKKIFNQIAIKSKNKPNSYVNNRKQKN